MLRRSGSRSASERMSYRQGARENPVSAAAGAVFERLENRRLLSAATPDPSFGTGGVVTDSFGGTIDADLSIAVQADGKILVAGNAGSSPFLARYSSGGVLEEGFTINLGAHGFDSVSGVAVTNDNKIVVAGTFGAGNSDLLVARFNDSGTLDNTFDGDGLYQHMLVGTSEVAAGVAVRGDGTILVAGTQDEAEFVMLQLTSGGELDSSFDGDGFAFVYSTDFGVVQDVALQNDGTAVAVGYTWDGVSGSFALVRVGTDGTSLGATITPGGTLGYHTSVAIGSGNVIYAAGNDGNGGVLLRYSSTGDFESSFGGSGVVTVPGSETDAYGVAVDADGNVLVTGANAGSTAFTVTRFDADGNLDTGFGSGGTVQTPLGTTAASYAIAVHAGKIVVAGAVDSDLGLVRYGAAVEPPPDEVTFAWSGANLVITGTAASESIIITRNPAGGVDIEVNGAPAGNFLVSGRIEIDFGDGDDQLNVSGSLDIPLFVNGGAGNDTLKGGRAHDILIGGPGDDRIMGGDGRDILIGGDGADMIHGLQSDDIIIAGTTAYDDDFVALRHIRKEWTRSDRTFMQRQASIRGDDDCGMNGSYYLAVSATAFSPVVTVFDDDSIDSLHGSNGSDWFFYNPDEDVVRDLSRNNFGESLA